jgi:pimeloyl-ACP methyl ester carboxylesterase
MRKFVAVFACVAIVGVAAGTASAATGDGGRPTVAAAGSINWGRCGDAFLRQFHARCGMLRVPLDHTDPSGPTIKIAVSRIRHTVPDSDYKGVILANPGGPGGSGLWTAALGQFIPRNAGAFYDWIGFDPRGVGSSVPSLSCIPNYVHGDRPPYVPRSNRLLSIWQTRSQRYADACAVAEPELLAHMTTKDVADDMDSIRQALGVSQISYYGFSYGTYLGQVYATRYPGNLARAVLDGVVDPTAVWHQANLNQDLAFERNMHIWFKWVARHHRAYHLGRTEDAVADIYRRTQRALKRHPAGGVVGPSEWADIFLYSAYWQFYWPFLADAFSRWENDGRARKLITAFQIFDGPGYDNLYAVYLAVECTDAAWPDWATYESDVWDTYAQAPLQSWANGWFNAPCMYWSVPGDPAPTAVDDDVTPFLLISETLDAATPYSGAVEVRNRFDNSALIAVEGGTNHANSLAGNACVDLKIAAFLKHDVLPARQPSEPDVSCDPLPAPRPSGRTLVPSSRIVAPSVSLAFRLKVR